MITLASMPAWIIWQHLPPIVFLFCFGACVGSFFNVVIYRLPTGMSVIMPPSRCPSCGVGLRFFRENLPILGWFFVRGRCRTCGERVSPQYMVVELAGAAGFVLLYLLFYTTAGTALGGPQWLDEIGGPWWRVNGIAVTWPAFLAIAFLITGLLAMLVIDARTCTIPMQIPQFVVGAAILFWPLQAMLPFRSPFLQSWPVPGTGWIGVGLAVGGAIGLAVSLALLFLGWFRPSFADYGEYVRDDQPLAEYPHARREMGREICYLLPIVIGLAAGGACGAVLTGVPSPLVQAAALPWLGYLVGAGVVWLLRILATLGFGREAMGLGDAHLMGAVGAVLGPFDPVLVFFIAPFFGMAWYAVERIRGLFAPREERGMARAMPFGPHLALAAILLILCRPLVDRGLEMLQIPPTPRGFQVERSGSGVAAPSAFGTLPSGPRSIGDAQPGRRAESCRRSRIILTIRTA